MATTEPREVGLEKIEPAEQEPPYPPERYAWYVVGVLMIVYVFSFIDRQILALLVGPIRADLGISEKQMSYLMGLSFAIFYTLFGIPMGRLADSKNRTVIIAVGLFLWSLMSAGCGVAKNYATLLLMRIGVGVGEATLSPSAYSLITDYFRPDKMALAQSVYGAGIYIGSGLAFLLGGFVVDFASTREAFEVAILGTVQPWQLVFFVIGLPGMLFTLALLTVREPERRGVLGKHAAKGSSVPLAEVAAYLRTNWGTFFCHCVGLSFLSFAAYGASQWVPTFYVRVHGWAPGDTGKLYGLAVVFFGTAGIIYGGILAGHLQRKGYVDGKMRTALIAAVCHLPLGLAFPLVPNAWLAYLIMCPATFFLAMPFGVGPAAIQQMMPNRMRGQAAAIYLFVVNLIGLGLGPTAVAIFTEDVFKDDNMVNYSLAITSTVAGVIAIILLGLGLSQFRNSIGRLKAWEDGQRAGA